MQPRCVHLRRPPTLCVVEEPFVPDGDLDEATRRWSALCAANPGFFDGRMYHVLGVHRNGCGGAVMHVIEAAYRFQAVQDEDFDLGVRALGAKGVTRRGDGRVLFGQRTTRVAAYPGMWELAPGGVVEPNEHPRETIVKELAEETHHGCAPPVAIAIIYDEVQRCWEVVYRITPDDRATPASTDEYDALHWCTLDATPGPLTPISRRIIDELGGV